MDYESVSSETTALVRQDPRFAGIMSVLVTRPVGELEIDDVADIDWSGLRVVLRDTIFRVEHEGEVSSRLVSDVVRFTSLALCKLEKELTALDLAEERVESMTGFIGWIVSLLPTVNGARARSIRREREALPEQRNDLTGHRHKITALRESLAKAVDGKLHDDLLVSDATYRDLHDERDRRDSLRKTADAMLREVRDALEWIQSLTDEGVAVSMLRATEARLEPALGRIPDLLLFCRAHSSVELPKEPRPIAGLLKTVFAELPSSRRPHASDRFQEAAVSFLRIKSCLESIISETDIRLSRDEQLFHAMRERRKRDIYAGRTG